MSKNIHDRFVDASEFVRQLKAYREGNLVNIYSYTKQELLRRFIHKHKVMVVMIFLLFIAIVTGAGFSIHYAIKMDEARKKAENALISVTALGEFAQEQATDVAETIKEGVDQLLVDMKITAEQLRTVDFESSNASIELLDQLHQLYPKFHAISIETAGSIPLAQGWKAGVHQYEAPMASIENGRLLLTFVVPITADGKDTKYLMASVFPEKVLPSFFPVELDAKHPKDIWVMQEDGVVIYDADPRFQSTNVFIDTINAQTATLVAFAKLTLETPYGISYYTLLEEGKKIFKIAAWHTVDFPNAKSWKIVVNYSYFETDSD